MSTVRFQLSTGSFTQDWTDTALISVDDNWDNVPSIVGYLGDRGSTTTANVDPRTLTAAGQIGPVDVIANATGTNPSAGGVHEIHGANPTIAFVGSGTADAPNIVIFLDATGRQDIRFQANIRDLDASADNAVQQLVVQWRTNEGTWDNLVYFADVTTQNSATQVTAIDASLPAGANNSATLEIRVMTTNAGGSDETIGIDDIIVSSTAAGPPPADTTAPTLAAVNPADPDDGATAVAVDSNIVLRFSENIVAGTGSFTLSNGTDVRTIAITDSQVSISGNTLTINPTTNLTAGTSYALTAPTGIVEDAAGNDFAGIAAGVLDFTTLFPLITRTIGAIQGLSHTSSFAGQIVRTEGVVTAVDSNGYYIQSAAGQSDGDARTSDGMFVFTSTAPGVTVGSLLEVTGTVAEFRPGNNAANLTTTQLTSATWLNLGTANVDTITIGSGGRLPPTQIIDNDSFAIYDPDQDGIDFWESLEGMMVTIDAPIAISNTNSFGETFVVASGGAGSTGQSSNGALTIAANDFNPERIQLDNDNDLFAGFNNVFSIGDRLSSVTGIVAYNFQSYEVLVTQAVTTTLDVTATKQITNLAETGGKLSVASYNLENLSANDDPVKIASLASDIVNSLKSPDIIGVQEIQDANGAQAGGSLSGQASAQALIDAIVLAGGPTYAYVEVAPASANSTGGEPNGNIRNGYLYDPSRVTYVDGSAQLIDVAAFNNSRKPLVASFQFNGETITLVNVHFTSRGGSDALWGATQPPANAADAARTAQGAAVRAYIDGLVTGNANAKVAVLGDFNGFTWEGGIGALTQGGLMQNLSDLLPAEERFTYQFEGNNQQLDHIVATANLVGRAEFDAVQINSQLPDALQISTDHDAALALFDFSKIINGTAAANTINGTALAETINGLGGNDRIFAGGNDDTVYGGAGNDLIRGGGGTNRLFGDAGDDTFGGDLEAGVHIIDGGAGNDTFVVTSAGERVVVNLATGTVTGGYAHGSTLTSIETVSARDVRFAVELIGGNLADVLNGGRMADVLNGGGGNDRLLGGAGADELTGGAGNDRFEMRRGEASGDIILDFEGAGIAGGDVLVLGGYGAGAFLSNVGDTWTINFGAGQTESFRIIGVTALGAGDVIFG